MAAAALKVECPEGNSPNGGVGRYGRHSSPLMGRGPSPGPPQASTSWPAYRNRMAVIGRTESKARLASQQAMAASSRAAVRAKNSGASSSRPWPSLTDTCWASRHQWPGGVSLPGPSAQYSAIALCSSVSTALSARSWAAWTA